jgi:hypothetical protein
MWTRVLLGIGLLIAAGSAWPLRPHASERASTASTAKPVGDRPAQPLWDTGTFSILGYDPQTGEIGGAVQSRVFSVGNGVLWADAAAGVAATQAIVDVSYGPQSLALLRKGVKPADIITRVLKADPDPLPKEWTKQGRQFAVMNLKGEYAAYTGPQATEWAGNKGGVYCTAQGNILAGPAVVSPTWWRTSKRRPAISRSASLQRSKADRPAAATSAASSRRR